ncbi:hypothetical protein CROQUDRAFT_655206 [Cronartium quercuum f. sp. fusiforme G11]|uniref:Uncharacterized protein n=1 Tax=Cronartium quercuum f. sp. fusiforme G11 TaxID=708437 RepID=A0A9P6NJP2_9BASI|nr:hypothetical protein CROQUDRAFT_655206 [Cronartium quercuum f. sp. fusiforme G11]
MADFEYNLISTSQAEEHHLWLSSDTLPMPNFLINDPHADSYTPYILEDSLIGLDEATELAYNDYLPDASSLTFTKSSGSFTPRTGPGNRHSSSAPEVTVTLERLIEQQSQLISKAFESWRSKYPIKPELNSVTETNRTASPKPSSKSSSVIRSRLNDQPDEEITGPINFDLWSIGCDKSAIGRDT